MKMKAENMAVTLLVILCAVIVTRADDHTYTTKYDDIDIDSVIKNDRLLNNYVGCLLDLNPCTPDAEELKKNLPDALENDCSLCSERQKMISDKLVQHLIDHRPDDWDLLEERYDSTGTYREKYLESKIDAEDESDDDEPDEE